MTERWADIAEAPSYEVSDHGRVRRKARLNAHVRQGRHVDVRLAEKIIEPERAQNTTTVRLHLDDGERIRRSVGRLVWLAFRGAVPEGIDVGTFGSLHVDALFLIKHVDLLALNNQQRVRSSDLTAQHLRRMAA